MTNREKYRYWKHLSDYDLQTAKIMLDMDRGTYVVTLCLQALERLIKGMIVYYTGKEAPKSNNITFLVNKLTQSKEFDHCERLEEEKDRYMEFFIEIMFYRNSDYPFSYKKVMDRFIGKEMAQKLYDGTASAINWLEGFQSL